MVPSPRQAIVGTNAGIVYRGISLDELTQLPLVRNICISVSGQYWLLSIGPLGTNFSDNSIKTQNF